MAKKTQPQNWKEARRLQALRLKRLGWLQKDIATALGVTEGAVSQWFKRAREEGEEALRHKPPPGPTPLLRDEDLAWLAELLCEGAEAHGFRGDLWTCRRVVTLVTRYFAISYSSGHMAKVLKRAGWTPQKPMKRARQRDEEAIKRWRVKRWPALKKRPRPKSALLSS